MKRIERECLGQCPRCGSFDVEYDPAEHDGDITVYPAKCYECNLRFDEEYTSKYSISYYDEEEDIQEDGIWKDLRLLKEYESSILFVKDMDNDRLASAVITSIKALQYCVNHGVKL